MSIPVQLIFSDGLTHTLHLSAGESVLHAARERGLSLLVDCEEGNCGTCQAQVSCGRLDMAAYNPSVLAESERAEGAVLLCRAQAIGPAVIDLPYSGDDALAAAEAGPSATVEAIEPVAASTVALTLTASEPVAFLPGQYVNIAPEGSFQRSFSMANPPGTQRLVFFVALHPGGRFSHWLASARVGSRVSLSAARGVFYLREGIQPKVMVAGGTGLAPFLSMLEQMARDDREDMRATPTVLLMGARHEDQLFGREQLESLKRRLPGLQVHVACDEVRLGSGIRQGRVTQLLDELDMSRDASIYACGPPPMVDAVKRLLPGKKIPTRQLYVEKFTG